MFRLCLLSCLLTSLLSATEHRVFWQDYQLSVMAPESWQRHLPESQPENFVLLLEDGANNNTLQLLAYARSPDSQNDPASTLDAFTQQLGEHATLFGRPLPITGQIGSNPAAFVLLEAVVRDPSQTDIPADIMLTAVQTDRATLLLMGITRHPMSDSERKALLDMTRSLQLIPAATLISPNE